MGYKSITFAKGKKTNSSDIDFLIWLDLETHNKIGYFYIINLQQILENVLQRNVDILLYQELGSLKEEILKTQYILFDNL
jgi:predicted nucleotidyltransferase